MVVKELTENYSLDFSLTTFALLGSKLSKMLGAFIFLQHRTIF